MNIFRTSSEASSLSEEEVILASERPKKRAGRRVFNETRHPVYRGVRRRNNNKWVCEMRVPGNNKTRIWLGTYPTPEMAARAHDVAALALRGKSACLNFADSAWRLSLPVSTDAAGIRKAAMEAAEAFAAEDNLKQQNVESSSTQYDEDCMVMEDANKGSNPDQQQEDEVAGVSEYENMNDLILSIANEPLRSPLHFARDGGDWNDVDRHDAEVSLWSFSF